MNMLKAALAVALLTCGSAAIANPILTDLPESVFITVNGLDWTWAAPVSVTDWFGSNTLSDPSLHAGWRYATEAEWNARPDATMFMGDGGNVIQSAVYWNTSFNYVDYNDGLQGSLSRTLDSGGFFNDIWYVRNHVTAGGVVPEPASWALMLGGFGLVGGAMRSRRKAAVSFG